jgi:hypothetical protein
MKNQTGGRVARATLAGVLVTLVVSIAAVATRIDNPALLKPFGTDEADYVRALSNGLVANYLGTNERSGVQFVREVAVEYKATGWARPFQEDWEKHDAAGLRHYHPPLGLYPMAALAGAGLRDERTLRLIPLVLGVLTCLCAGLLASLMADGRSRFASALIAGLLVASSPYHVAASTELSFHVAFGLLSTLTLVCLVMTSGTRHIGWWCAASASFALTILTVPYWLILLPPYLWVGWSTIRRTAGATRAALSALGAAVGALVVAWPPFLAHAAFVKPLMMYGGIILKPLPGTATTSSWLTQLGLTHWLTIVCVATGLAGLLWSRSRVPRSWIPAALFCAGFIVVNVRVAHMKPLYGSDLIAPLSALAAASAASLGPVPQSVVVVAALGVSLYARISTGRQDSTPPWRSEMDALSHSLSGARVLVTPRPAGAIVAYYAQDSHVVLDSGNATDVSELRASAARGEIDAVLQWGGTAEPGGAARELMRVDPDATFLIARTPVQLTRLAARPAIKKELTPTH